MSVTIDNIAEKILSNDIDKQEALRSFENLSEDERDLLISKLRFKLSDGDDESLSANTKYRHLKSFSERTLNDEHKAFIKKLAVKLGKFAPKSKENALINQDYFVDQRKISNLKRAIKSLQFHITYEKAEGPYLFDIDGNKYIDVTGDNGVNIFGHQPKFIKKAIEDRVNKGFPLVGYTEELFKAAKLFCELTEHERVLFTQSGTEAVMWAVRIARAATQKKKIVIFEGSYHGLSDAVIGFKDQEGKSHAMGLGMLQEFADQLIILDYGNMDQLHVIEDRAGEIATVLVEPVQSRNPDNQPVEFLKELRKITLEKEIPLILDEMITGFRACPKGAQGVFNVKADIATYGKIPGGGMPTGMIAGLAKYMDYVDGGTWRFDDDSMPSLKRTLMAGTHTRNPVKIAATLATLTEINKRCKGKRECDSCTCFQKDLNKKTKAMVDEVNEFFRENRLPVVIVYFSSLFRFKFFDDPNGVVSELFLIILRMNFVETSVSGNFFLTTAHTNKHIKSIVKAIKDTMRTLMEENFFYEPEEDEPVTPVLRKESAYKPMPANKVDSPAKRVAPVSSAIPVASAAEIDESQIEKLKDLIKRDLQNFQEGGN